MWVNYKLNLDLLPALERSTIRSKLKQSFLQSITALYDFKNIYNGKINTWDYQYAFYQLLNRGLSIVPNINLVQNIGFGDSATHNQIKNKSLRINTAKENNYLYLKPPQFIMPDFQADKYTYNKRTRLLKKMYVLLWYFINYKCFKRND